MKNSRKLVATILVALILTVGGVGLAGSTANAAHVLPVGLGTASPFAILAGTTITNVPTSVITGDVGLSSGTGTGIGLGCTEVSGTIYSVDAAGPLPCRVTDAGLLTTAKNALTAAIGDAAGRSGGIPVAANQLAGKTLTHGVYSSGAAMNLSIGGTLTLDGGGDPNAVFIFQLGTLLTVDNGSTVALINQARSCNVYWQVDSATIGTTAMFRGTILAATSITVNNGSTVDGRLLAGTGAVTLISDTIIRSTCSASAVPVLPPCEFMVNLPNAPCAGTRLTPVPASTTAPAPSTATVAPSAAGVATATPTGATATPTGATATPTGATATPTVASTPALVVAGVQQLPSTSTDEQFSPLLILAIALGGIGVLMLLRRPLRHL